MSDSVLLASGLSLTRVDASSATMVYLGTSYDLGNISASAEAMTCNVLGVFGISEADLAINWNATSVTVTIANCLDPTKNGAKTYAATPAELATLATFAKSYTNGGA